MVGVEQGYGISVPRIVTRGIDMAQRILCIWIGAVLGKVKGFVVFDFVTRRLEEESYACQCWVSLRQDEAGVLGRFSSSIAAYRGPNRDCLRGIQAAANRAERGRAFLVKTLEQQRLWLYPVCTRIEAQRWGLHCRPPAHQRTAATNDAGVHGFRYS